MQLTYKDRFGRSFELRERVVYPVQFYPRPSVVQEWHQVSADAAVASPPAAKTVPTVDLSGIEVPDVEVPAGILSLEQRLKVEHHILIVAALRVTDMPDVKHVSPADFEALRKIAGECEHRLRSGDV